MSVKDALLEVQRGFALSDDVSLTQLRSSRWLGRLNKAHKLRLMSRNKTVGVVVEATVWEAPLKPPAGEACEHEAKGSASASLRLPWG